MRVEDLLKSLDAARASNDADRGKINGLHENLRECATGWAKRFREQPERPGYVEIVVDDRPSDPIVVATLKARIDGEEMLLVGALRLGAYRTTHEVTVEIGPWFVPAGGGQPHLLPVATISALTKPDELIGRFLEIVVEKGGASMPRG